MTTLRDARRGTRRHYPSPRGGGLLLVAGLIALAFCAGCPRRPRDSGRPHARADVRAGEATAGAAALDDRDAASLTRVLPPARGCLYHGVHPGGAEGEEDVVLYRPEVLADYVREAGRAPAFVYFSHEWGYEDGDDTKGMKSHAFPKAEIERMARGGAVPFVRLMLRSYTDPAADKPEKYFTLENIVGTGLNEKRRAVHEQIVRDLREWGRVAREEYRGPLVVEWGTEANNKTFHWNAQHQGRDKKKAAALFRKAFRLIAREVSGGPPGQSNITWAFHVTAESDPDKDWNRMSAYFPDGTAEDAANVVDWLGVSVYGVDNLDTGECAPFAAQLDAALGSPVGTGAGERLRALARRGGKDRPVLVLEFGAAANYRPAEGVSSPCHPQTWTGRAFEEMFRRADEGTLAGFSWWSERFEGDGPSKIPVEMRVSEFKNFVGGDGLLRAYRAALDDRRVANSSAAGHGGGLPACRVLTAAAPER